MSGSEPSIPVVDLMGTSMTALVHAIPATVHRTGRPVTVIGGLAVVCRLSTPHRATSDLDTVDSRKQAQTPQLELLVRSGAKISGPSGALVPTPIGDVQVDVLGVTDAELRDLPDDATDRLHVLSHAWAADTASPVVIRAGGVPNVTVRVAHSGPLVAMKLQSIMNRPAAKEGTDLLDIIRLSLDRGTGPLVREQLSHADQQLKSDARLHVQRWFETFAARSLKRVNGVPEGRQIALDDIHLVGELLAGALSE